MILSKGKGGWFAIQGTALPGIVYVRVTEVDGRTRITELYIDGRGEPIQPAALRKFPLAGLEVEVLDMIDGRADGGPGPDLSTLAAHFATGFGRVDESDWVNLAYCAQLPKSGVRRPPRPELVTQRMEAPVEVRLSPPEGGLTDEFLTDVARAYRAAVAAERPPATAIAEQLPGYPTGDTQSDKDGRKAMRRLVESWVYKARKRGLMDAAPRPGRIY